MTPNDPTKVNADSLDGGESIQTTLGELWELLDEGTHEAWPECLQLRTFKYAGGDLYPVYSFVPDSMGSAGDDDPCTKGGIRWEHALDLVTTECERWLVGKGWNIISPGLTLLREYEHSGYNTEYIGLTDAVRYAMGKENV